MFLKICQGTVSEGLYINPKTDVGGHSVSHWETHLSELALCGRRLEDEDYGSLHLSLHSH